MGGRDRNEIAGPPGGGRPYQSPGARKEQLRVRAFRHGAGGRSPVPYAELRCASAFSFLDGASLPEDLVERAAALDLPAVALVDRHGVYGAPRFWKAAKAAGIKALVGAEVPVEKEGQARISAGLRAASPGREEMRACPSFLTGTSAPTRALIPAARAAFQKRGAP